MFIAIATIIFFVFFSAALVIAACILSSRRKSIDPVVYTSGESLPNAPPPDFGGNPVNGE